MSMFSFLQFTALIAHGDVGVPEKTIGHNDADGNQMIA